MPLMYHEMGHSVDKEEAGISVAVYLREGIYSRGKYREFGRLTSASSSLEMQKKREEYILDRQKFINEKLDEGADPSHINFLLESHLESLVNMYEFYLPGVYGNRDESVFFGYHETPSDYRDWVAIECNGNTELHDASCRDRNEYRRWKSTTVTLDHYIRDTSNNTNFRPPRWTSNYNEAIFLDHMPPKRIIAYAKIEKTVTTLNNAELSEDKLDTVKAILNASFSFATQFSSKEENILVHWNNDDKKYELRISFNKAKADETATQIENILNSFENFEELLISPLVFIARIINHEMANNHSRLCFFGKDSKVTQAQQAVQQLVAKGETATDEDVQQTIASLKIIYATKRNPLSRFFNTATPQSYTRFLAMAKDIDHSAPQTAGATM